MVGKIATYRFSHRFKKQYKMLPANIQRTFHAKLSLMLDDMEHPSLRIKKIQGAANRWEGSVTMKYRFTFHLDEETLVLRTIGTHDILLRK